MVALVTGASSGMGREFTKQITHFYKNLDEIWVIARRKERLEELEKTLLVPVRIFCGDLLHPPVYHELRTVLEEEKPDIRMLVNAAGFGKSGLAEDIKGRSKSAIKDDRPELYCVIQNDIFVSEIYEGRKQDY